MTLIERIQPDALRATVEHLAKYPTRNTLSPCCNEACEWLAEQYGAIPGVRVETMTYTLKPGKRVQEPQEAVQVLAWLPGESDRLVLVTAHIDSLNLTAGPDFAPAPGANDDASGVALGLEVARALADQPRGCSLLFVAFSGEEQGLQGARALAQRARDERWAIQGVFNHDMVGSSGNLAGQSDPHRVRVFSDEVLAPDAIGSSRELARWMEFATRQHVPGFGIKLVMRADRYGRGGDHTPFHQAGFPAVRLTEVHEEYARQHTPDDRPDAMDFGYLADVSRLTLVAASKLAQSAAPPANVHLDLSQSHDARIHWTGDGPFEVYWRETTSAVWQGKVETQEPSIVLPFINKDDHAFAVSNLHGLPVPAG